MVDKKRRNKAKKDIISESEYNAQIANEDATPQDDSPGDSEKDTGAEFIMGLNYMPNENREYTEDSEEALADLSREQDETSESAELSENAKVVSSEPPSPRLDLDADSDTH